MDIDLTAAEYAAEKAYMPTVGQPVSNRERIAVIVAAAAPLIEAAVRAQIAQDLDSVAEGYSAMSHDRGVFSAAARIARDGA